MYHNVSKYISEKGFMFVVCVHNNVFLSKYLKITRNFIVDL